ncbi:MAG: twitching motility protein PilT [Candidatus Aminicenantes bacterium RBG_13_63_10]|nr:MAG: twitching motility protein PilT [Candidatus Aminicenantes bacterium RBG_13_63_10]
MNLVDSSGWLEYFTDGPNAALFEKPLRNTERLLVPAVCLYEVFKVVLRERGENDALQAAALMRQGTVADLDPETALRAAKLSLEFKLPMADSIILATAEAYEAMIWTQDAYFEKFKNVKFFGKKA